MAPLNSLPLTRVSEILSSQGDHVERLLAEPLQPSSMGPEQGNTLCRDTQTTNQPMFEGHLTVATDVTIFVKLWVQPVHEGPQTWVVAWAQSSQKNLVGARFYLLCITRVWELADTLMFGLRVLKKTFIYWYSWEGCVGAITTLLYRAQNRPTIHTSQSYLKSFG